MLRTGKYCLLSKKGEVLKGTRNTPSKKYMAPILDNLSRLDNYFAEKFDPAKEEEIQDCFKDTILSCENYIANRNPWTSEGKARLQMVKDFKEQLRTESVRFAEKVQGMLKEKDEASKDKTWLQVLTEVRTENVEEKKSGYKISEGGAGSSKVYILEKDGKKQFFKQSEKLPSGRLYGTLDENIKELNKSKDEKDKRRAEYITTIKEAAFKNRKARYSPKAFRQLLNLQIFDIICGQVDRNAGNYLCQKVEKQDSNITEITELKAIDNDTCFGDLKYKDIFARGSKGLNRLRNIEDRNGINVPYMDKEFADKILALEPKQVDYVLCDILTQKERDASIDRLKGVQKAIRKRINVENKLKAKTGKVDSIFISNEKDKDNWGKVYADFSEKIKQMK